VLTKVASSGLGRLKQCLFADLVFWRLDQRCKFFDCEPLMN
jgi:hypothetical protein